MTDENVVLWAGCYELKCTECGHRQLVTHAAAHIECERCREMIITKPPEHTFAGNGNGRSDGHAPGTLVIVTYRWTCPDCKTANNVRGAAQQVLCSRCGAKFTVAEVKATSANRQIRLM